MLTDVINVDGEDYDYVDLSKGIVMEIGQTQHNVEVDVGHGIRLYTTLYKGKKYYGNAKLLEAKDAVIDELNVFKLGEELPELYTDIACVYRMDTVGFGNTVKHVKFNEDQEMHVYGEELTYLGTTAEELPYSNYYFLAHTRLPQLETDSEYAQEPGYAMSGTSPGIRAPRVEYDETPVTGGSDEEDDEDYEDEDSAVEIEAPVKTEKPADDTQPAAETQKVTPRNNWADTLA